MANHLWIKLYPTSSVEHLPIVGFYNAPILIDTHNRSNNYNHRGFKFETTWLLNTDLLDPVRSIWTTFIKGSYAYELISKTNLLKQENQKMENQERKGK